MNLSSIRVWGALLALAAAPAWSQQPPAQPAPLVQPAPVVVTEGLRPDYVLGANDQILVRSNAEELNDRPFRVDQQGGIVFPLINRVQVAGLTVQALEAQMVALLRQYLVQPTVNITVTGFRSEVVSFFGAFVRPGIVPLTGGHTLLEMLSVVGGFQPNATRRLRVSRRAEYGPIPLPSAIQDPVNGTSTVEINLDSLLRDINPPEDIVLQAYDRITVDQAAPIYVNGEVARPAALVLSGQESMTVMQALAQAGGFTAAAKREDIAVLRPVVGTARLAKIPVDLKRIMNGQENDFPLFPNDILFVGRLPMIQQILPQTVQGLIQNLPFVLVTGVLQ